MNLRLLTTAALLSIGLSGCAIDPYAMNGIGWYQPPGGDPYYHQTYASWMPPAYHSPRQAPQSHAEYREDTRQPHRDREPQQQLSSSFHHQEQVRQPHHDQPPAAPANNSRPHPAETQRPNHDHQPDEHKDHPFPGR